MKRKRHLESSPGGEDAMDDDAEDMDDDIMRDEARLFMYSCCFPKLTLSVVFPPHCRAFESPNALQLRALI